MPTLLLKAATAEDVDHRLVRKKKRNVSYKSLLMNSVFIHVGIYSDFVFER